MDQTFVCPHNGADVSVDACFCRECGADDSDGSALFDDNFDYDDYLQREFGQYVAPNARAHIAKVVIVLIIFLSLLGLSL